MGDANSVDIFLVNSELSLGIALRLCAYIRRIGELQPGVIRSLEDTPLEVIELYIQ